MTLSIIRGAEAEERMKDPHFLGQWRKLYEACPWATGCQCPGFVTAWHEAYRDCYEALAICELSASGELTGLFSLAKEKDSGRVVAAGAHQAEYKTWLAQPANGDSFIAAALERLASEPDISTLVLRYLPPRTPLDWMARSPGRRWTCELEPWPRPIIPIARKEEVAEYIRKKRTKSTKSKWNRLRRLGNLSLDQIQKADQLAPIFDELIVYNDVRQGGLHGKFDFQDDAAKKPFHLALLNTPNLLHATVLRADDKILSAVFGVISAGTFSFAMPMISPFCAPHSPMTVHLLMLLEKMQQDGYTTFDLTASMDPFKERFAAKFDSVGVLSIYFRNGDLIRHRVRRAGETLARRALRSARIAPNSALEHWRQMRRVPLGKWPRELIRESKRRLWGKRLNVYVLETENPPALEGPTLMSRDHLKDLLSFQSVELWRTRSGFMAEALRRIEKGHHFYTCVEQGRLVHISWLAEDYEAGVIPGMDAYQFPAGSAVLYGGYTDPGARGRGLFRAALRQMLRDASQAVGVWHVFAALPASNKRVNEFAAQLGLVPFPKGRDGDENKPGSRKVQLKPAAQSNVAR